MHLSPGQSRGVSPELLLPALHSLHYQQLVPGGTGSGPEQLLLCHSALNPIASRCWGDASLSLLSHPFFLISFHLSQTSKTLSTAKLGAVPQCLPSGLIVPMALLFLTLSSGLAGNTVAMVSGVTDREKALSEIAWIRRLWACKVSKRNGEGGLSWDSWK